MENHIFLVKEYEEGPTTYYAIPEDKIVEMNLSDTYDNYGQIVGHDGAGDYHMENYQSDAAKDCIKAICEKFQIQFDNIHIVYNSGEFEIEPGDGEEYGFSETEVNQFIKSWRGQNESLTTCKGFNFWDGHNWQSVIVESGDFDIDYKVVNDEKITTELNEAIKESKFFGEGFGEKRYRTDDYVVIDNYCQGHWESYMVIPFQEYVKHVAWN